MECMDTTLYQKPKALYFDLGNTLIYYDTPWPESLPRLINPFFQHLRNSGLSFDDETLRKMVMQEILLREPKEEENFRELPARQVLSDILHRMGFDHFDAEFVHSALRVMFSIAESHWQPEEDAIPLFRDLKQRGYLVGLISNASDDENVQNLIDKGGLRPYLDMVVSSASYGFGKPGKEIFQFALAELGIHPSEAVMVGDTLRADILGANRMGMKSIWITRRARNSDQPIINPEMQPWKAVQTLREIIDLII